MKTRIITIASLALAFVALVYAWYVVHNVPECADLTLPADLCDIKGLTIEGCTY